MIEVTHHNHSLCSPSVPHPSSIFPDREHADICIFSSRASSSTTNSTGYPAHLPVQTFVHKGNGTENILISTLVKKTYSKTARFMSATDVSSSLFAYEALVDSRSTEFFEDVFAKDTRPANCLVMELFWKSFFVVFRISDIQIRRK